MNEQLERELGQALATQAETTHRAPFTMDEIRGTSARIKRRRSATASGAIAASIALLVPALLLGGDRDASIDPASPPSAPETSVESSTLPGVNGPGVRVELADAARHNLIEAEDRGIDPNMLVVHAQDIQAVVVAMRAAGAEAITVNDQRVAPSTVIEGDGSAVVLDGVRHPQPFVIEAVGDPDALVRAINRNGYLAQYRSQASDPLVAIGWRLEVETHVHAPAYRPAAPR